MHIKIILNTFLLIAVINSNPIYAQNTNSASNSSNIQDLNIVWNIGETVNGSTKNAIAGGVIQVLEIIEEKNNTHVISNIEDKFDMNVSAYPNPTFNKLTINFNKTSTYTLIVYNLNGRVINQLEVNKKLLTYDFSDYEKGLYMIQIRNKKSSLTKTIKILKK